MTSLARGWPAIDTLRAEIAAAERRRGKRAHLHRRHFVLVADQIRSELAADRARGRRFGPPAAAPTGKIGRQDVFAASDADADQGYRGRRA
jgi:hypothetical protein